MNNDADFRMLQYAIGLSYMGLLRPDALMYYAFRLLWTLFGA